MSNDNDTMMILVEAHNFVHCMLGILALPLENVAVDPGYFLVEVNCEEIEMERSPRVEPFP
jgi:hypothetical protein